MSTEFAPHISDEYLPPLPPMEREFSHGQLVRYAGELAEIYGGSDFTDGITDACKTSYLYREAGMPDYIHIIFEGSRQRNDTFLDDDKAKRSVIPEVWQAPVEYSVVTEIGDERHLEACPANLVTRIKNDFEKIAMPFEPDKIGVMQIIAATIIFSTESEFYIESNTRFKVMGEDYLVDDDGEIKTHQELHADDDVDEDDDAENENDTDQDSNENPDLEGFEGIDFGDLGEGLTEVILADGRLQAKQLLDIMHYKGQAPNDDGRTTPLF